MPQKSFYKRGARHCERPKGAKQSPWSEEIASSSRFARLLAMTCCFLFLAIIISGCGSSFHFSKSKVLKAGAFGDTGSIAGSHAFRVGEKLTYEVRWMGVPVGLAYFNVKEIANVNGSDCYHIIVTVKSNAFLSKIYRVEDEFHTYIDKEKLYSQRFIKKQAEGRYRSHEIVNYDHGQRKAVYKSLRNDSVKEFDIKEGTQDDLSAIYYFRIQDIDLSKKIIMDVNADEKNWALEIRILGRGFMNISRIGKVEAIEVEPIATRVDGKKMQKGRLWLWFSADEARLPLAAKARAPIAGTVTAILVGIE